MIAPDAFAQILPPAAASHACAIGDPLDRGQPDRHAEHEAGRHAAQVALEQLGVTCRDLPAGSDGAPVWPAGIVGSISHKGGAVACAVARSTDLAGLGIDIEVNGPVREGVLARIASEQEIEQLAAVAGALPGVFAERLIFSAKEAAAKALAAAGGGLPALEDVAISLGSGTFTACGVTGQSLDLSGRWTRAGRLLLTAAVLERR